MELVNLEGVAPVGALHQVAMFVDESATAELQQMLGLVARDLLFKLIARQAAVLRLSLSGEGDQRGDIRS